MSQYALPPNRPEPPRAWGERVRYGKWLIELQYPPIPIGSIFTYTHDDYDGDEDLKHCGWCQTFDEACERLEELRDDNE